jgi:thioredoxin reductase
MEKSESYEVVIIGGSFAGLSAAMSLGRSLRSVLIVDNGNPCNRQTPKSHNFLTQDGAPPAAIAQLAREQVLRYKTVTLISDTVVGATGADFNFSVTSASGLTVKTKKLIFASGIKDQLPEMDGFNECWGISVVHCPYCHGYEYAGKRTGLLLNDDTVTDFAGLIGNLTEQLTIFTNGKSAISEENTASLRRNKIDLIEKPINRVLHRSGQLEGLAFDDGQVAELDALYVRLPFTQHCALPEAIGCRLTQHGHIEVNDLKQTSLPGVYAVGDAASPMRSVANAVAAGNFVGAVINRELVLNQWQ